MVQLLGKILVVEDEIAIQTLIAVNLKKAGCKTFLVKSPKNKDYILDVKPDYFVKNALYAVKKILAL